VSGRAGRLLVVNPDAGAVTPDVVERLTAALPDHEPVVFDPDRDLRSMVSPDATVVVAGGDGTVGLVLRALAGTSVRVGILPLGTFDNFARSLRLPADLDAAVEVVRRGHAHPVKLGRVAGRYFVEAAALGLFGEVIALGEAAKDRAYGELAERLRVVSDARPFRYRLGGDLEGSGTAFSLVLSNTPTTGARLEVGDATPEDPHLELSLGVAERRADLLARMVAAVVRRGRPPREQLALRFRRLEVRTRPSVPVYADTDEVGTTPVTVEAVPGAIRVIVPD
jgi:diacylglycerol kinase family enzyme